MENKKGFLKNWNEQKGFGFVDDCFCHISKFRGKCGNDEIVDGLEVQYIEEKTDKGLQVKEIIVVKKTDNTQRIKQNNNSSNCFMKSYLDDFTSRKFSDNLSLEVFSNFSQDFNNIRSSTSIRKVFDSFLSSVYTQRDEEKKLSSIELWFVRILDKEQKEVLPKGISDFFRQLLKKLNGDIKKFKIWLEVFIVYHKYFNPTAK